MFKKNAVLAKHGHILGFVKTMPALRKMSIAGNDFMHDKKLKEEVDKELAESGVQIGSATGS